MGNDKYFRFYYYDGFAKIPPNKNGSFVKASETEKKKRRYLEIEKTKD